MDGNHGIVVFDGVCNLCSSSVKFIINRDKKGYFKFVSLQSKIASELLKNREFKIAPDSVILIEGNELYFRSKAVLKICSKLTWPWKIISWLRVLPAFLLDPFYKITARFRYAIWGKKNECMLPGPDIKDRFLS